MQTVTEFWKPLPLTPARDPRARALLYPAIASAIGFFAFAVLAYSFTEMSMLPAWFRAGLVVVGAVALAVGGEIGTLTATVEIYRKHKAGAAIWWDWIGLGISLTATVFEFVLAFAALLGVNATWGGAVRLYGPIALGVLAALDSYVNFMEYGLYLASYDERLETWENERDAYAEREAKRVERRGNRSATAAELHLTPAPPAVTALGATCAPAGATVAQPATLPTPAAQPVADVLAWRATYPKLNGQRATLTTAQVRETLEGAGYQVQVSETTLRKWRDEARISVRGVA